MLWWHKKQCWFMCTAWLISAGNVGFRGSKTQKVQVQRHPICCSQSCCGSGCRNCPKSVDFYPNLRLLLTQIDTQWPWIRMPDQKWNADCRTPFGPREHLNDQEQSDLFEVNHQWWETRTRQQAQLSEDPTHFATSSSASGPKCELRVQTHQLFPTTITKLFLGCF